MFSAVRSHLNRQDVIQVALLLICLGGAWFVPRFLDREFAFVEAAGKRLAHFKAGAILAIFAAVIVIRLCVLLKLPVPFPQFHDEFSYLLAADTFAHGRLANPPHSMWFFFDTFHVNQHPAYMSKYPPAQGAVLAFGELLGHPWIGVLLSCAAMCAAVLWALQGWLPPPWALLGAAMLMLRVALFSYWMNSYWGGAVAAMGGALVLGAFPRLLRRWRIRDATMLGLGAAILANSRPFEGLIFCLPIAARLTIHLWKGRPELWTKAVPNFLVPLCLLGLVCGAFMAYYNWRGTGNPFLSPYVLNDRIYLSTPVFIWQRPGPPLSHTNRQLDDFYNGWARSSWMQGRPNGLGGIAKATVLDVARLTYYFLFPELCIPALAFFLSIRSGKFRFLMLELVACIGGFVLVPWFQPHYAAPLVAALFCAIVQGLRHIRHWKYQDRPVGVALSRVLVLSTVIFAVWHHQFPPSFPRGMEYRDRFSAQLKATPGDHLVMVRYSNEHNPLAEWVYNNADIDHAKIVWARDIPGAERNTLLKYFRERKVWLAEPDARPPRIVLYSEASRLE
jgi:hypothetical protein